VQTIALQPIKPISDEKNIHNSLAYTKFLSTFAAENLVPQAQVLDVLRIKRESGENPEQTRCCIFHQVVTQSFSVTVRPPDGKAA